MERIEVRIEAAEEDCERVHLATYRGLKTEWSQEHKVYVPEFIVAVLGAMRTLV